jgi:N-acyl-D-aspartate/D-glutamate deacylase
MVGHHTVRIAAMGMKDEPVTDFAREHMRASIAEAFGNGAVGFSTGLIYPPGVFSTTQELADLVKTLPADAVYATHMRGEGAQVFASITEALSVAERTGRRLQISHLKIAGKYNWGRMDEALELINNARARGVDVRQDIYPYTAGSTMLTACLPPWFQDGGNPAVLRRLDDGASVDRLRKDLERISMDWENMAIGAGWEGIVVSSTADHQFEGRSIADIAEQEGLDPVQALLHVLREEQLQATMTVHQMSEDDVITALEDPFTMIGSDGLPPGTGGRPHPRMYGTFPRIIARFSRDLGVLSAAEAIRRMTSLPADTFGLSDRGVIAQGKKADLVAFVPADVRDTATFEDPVRSPEGMPWVMVNGQVVVEGAQYVGGRHGRRVKRGA